MPAFEQRRHVIAALILAAFVASLGVVSFERKVASFQVLGFRADVQDGGVWLVRAVTDPATGLEVGDMVIQVAGEQPRSPKRLREVLHEEPKTDLMVSRGGTFVEVSYHRPALAIDLPYLVFCLVALAYLLIGLFTVLRRAQKPAMLFFAWCLASAALYIMSPAAFPADGLDKAIYFADQIARSLLPALTLHLLLVFPAGLPTFERAKKLVPFVYLPAAATLGLRADMILNGGRLVSGPPTEAKLIALGQWELGALIAFSLAGAAALAWRLMRHRDPLAFRQAQWVLAGVVGGYLPFLAFYALPRFLDLGSPAWAVLLAVVSLALVPVGFAYAILRYRLWDLGSILRDAVANSTTLLLGIFGFLLLNQLVSHSAIGRDLGMARNLLAFAAGIGIAGVLVPARTVVAGRLDRWRYGSRLADRRAMHQLGQELLHERDLDQLCQLLLRHLRDGLATESVNLLLVEPGGLVPVRPEAGLPRVFDDGAFDAGFWQRDVVRLAGAPLQAVPDSEQRLYMAGYRYLFPLSVRGKPVGLAVLGSRADDAPLTGEDISLARSVLTQAALAIENAHLLDEVRRQLEHVIRLEASSQGILESSPAGIALIEADGKVGMANHAFAAMVGALRPDVLGQQIVDLIPATAFLDPGQGMTEVAWCDATGQEHYLQLALAHHAAASGDAGHVIVVQDLSEKRRMEAALQEKERLAALGMMAAGVAHEVNTPLTGISSYAQMLLADAPEGHPSRGMLEKMERQTFRASQIVNNLLAFARHRGEPMHRMTLDRVVRECTEVLSARAAEAAVTITRSDRDAEPVTILGHEGELTQVLNNLLINAIDAMEAQDPSLPRELAVGVGSEDDRVVLRVADTGPGIAPERLGRVFEPFFSSKLHSGGSGLGLAICHNIVLRHGGEIRVENRPDRGSVFTIRLPRHEEP